MISKRDYRQISCNFGVVYGYRVISGVKLRKACSATGQAFTQGSTWDKETLRTFYSFQYKYTHIIESKKTSVQAHHHQDPMAIKEL